MATESNPPIGDLSEFEKYGKKSERALHAALSGGVKECLFLPSGRKVLSVVGRLGDELIDPDKPYCSCSNFYFRVLGGREDLCYHLIAHAIATKLEKVDVIRFSDEEFAPYFSALVRDIFDELGRDGTSRLA
jgi:predicted nucleic acid-binding Zn finger protein